MSRNLTGFLRNSGAKSFYEVFFAKISNSHVKAITAICVVLIRIDIFRHALSLAKSAVYRNDYQPTDEEQSRFLNTKRMDLV